MFLESVKTYHQKENILIGKTNFDNRNIVQDLDSVNSYKSSIKLSSDIFEIIQKNKDGKTTGIDSKTLRKSIEDSINKTKKNTFRTAKIEVAKKVVSLKPEIKDKELSDQLKVLIEKIKSVNNLDL